MTESLAAGTTWLGVTAGLCSAACMSLAYLLSRHHALAQPVAERPAATLGLLLRTHVVMGLVAAPAAAGLCGGKLPPLAGIGGPLIGAAGFYLLGNAFFFSLLRQVESSRLTPFLGLKVFFVALLAAVFFGQPLTGNQWLAVMLSVAATALLQGTVGGLGRRALARVLVVCLLFALSDLSIVALIDRLEHTVGGIRGRLTAAVLGMLLAYVICGLACAVPLLGGRRRSATAGAWRAAITYAATWLLAMVGLYICFGLVGAVFGNVVQSTRGIMAVVIGATLAHLGWHELEQRVDRATLLRRIGAAGLMTTAIALSVL